MFPGRASESVHWWRCSYLLLSQLFHLNAKLSLIKKGPPRAGWTLHYDSLLGISGTWWKEGRKVGFIIQTRDNPSSVNHWIWAVSFHLRQIIKIIHEAEPWHCYDTLSVEQRWTLKQNLLRVWRYQTWLITFHLCHQAESGSYQKMGANKPINTLFFIYLKKKTSSLTD